MQAGRLPQFLGHWSSSTSSKSLLDMVEGLHLQLRSCPPLFCNFKWFNIKAAIAHHPVIQKEVDELLAKDPIG